MIEISELSVFVYKNLEGKEERAMIDVVDEKPAYLIKAEIAKEKTDKDYAQKVQRAKNEARKRDDHNKYTWGGIVKKFYPDIVRFEENEAQRILKAALNSDPFRREVQNVEAEWKAKQRNANAHTQPDREHKNDAE